MRTGHDGLTQLTGCRPFHPRTGDPAPRCLNKAGLAVVCGLVMMG
jgi:hypothetical protein